MRLKELSDRMKIRKVLMDASIEELMITKDEVNKEINRRNKKK